MFKIVFVSPLYLLSCNVQSNLSDDKIITCYILDRPSVPQGPLDVSDVTKESAKLSYRQPADDGGTPILHYIIEKMDTTRGAWSDAGMSLTLYHTVERLIHKKQYYFRVKAVNAIGESEPLETTKPITAQNEFGKLFHLFTFVEFYLTLKCLHYAVHGAKS